ITHYGEKPPPGLSVTTVDVRPFGVLGDDRADECHSIRCQKENFDKQKPAQAPPVVVQKSNAPHGLAFEIFIKLERGMTEAEVLGYTGNPDQEVFEGTAESSVAIASANRSVNPQSGQTSRNALIQRSAVNLVVKTYYYLPTVSDPFTTIVTFTGGRVSEIQRIRKL
ncbi:MAG: hypothetical protein ACREUV_04590, partial [Burkholderiales bacterium]